MAQTKAKRKYTTKSKKNERPQPGPSDPGTGSGPGQRMLEDMQLHGFSNGTQKNYMDAVRMLANHYQRRASRLTEEQFRDFFLFLVNEKKLVRQILTQFITLFTEEYWDTEKDHCHISQL